MIKLCVLLTIARVRLQSFEVYLYILIGREKPWLELTFINNLHGLFLSLLTQLYHLHLNLRGQAEYWSNSAVEEKQNDSCQCVIMRPVTYNNLSLKSWSLFTGHPVKTRTDLFSRPDRFSSESLSQLTRALVQGGYNLVSYSCLEYC